MEEKRNNTKKKTLTYSQTQQEESEQFLSTHSSPRKKIGAWKPKLGDKVVLPYPRVCTLGKHNLTTHRVLTYKESEKTKCPSRPSAQQSKKPI